MGILGGIGLCMRRRERKILEEGDNSRTRISVNNSEDKEWRGICSQYYWSVGSGARKPMGFLGPAHDESWLAGWHIILLIKARTKSWKKKEPTRFTANCWIYHKFQVFKFQVCRY